MHMETSPYFPSVTKPVPAKVLADIVADLLAVRPNPNAGGLQKEFDEIDR